MVIDLMGRLTRLLRRQSTESLAAWFIDAAATLLARFAANNLHRDIDALPGAIETLWTTSPVEGQINRPKMIKRTMYGRPSFDLLRERVMASG